MPKYITIPGFKGGVANDIFENLQNQTYQTSKDLDVFTRKNILTPYSIFSTVTNPTVTGGSSLQVLNAYYASDGYYYFIGRADISSSVNLVLWRTPSNGSDLTASPSYTTVITAVSVSPSNQLEEFKDGLYFGYGTTLKRLTTTAVAVTFTVTVATPGVFTATGHGLAAGDAVIFATTGALPTGLTAGTIYYVISAGLTSDDFEVSATVGGSAINTTGTQSGTHTMTMQTKTISSALTSLGVLRSHTGVGKILFGNGHAVGTYDGTTLSLTALTLRTDENIVDIQPYSKFAVIGINDSNNAKKSRFLIWDMSSTTIDDVIDTGDTGLKSFKIVGNEIRAVFGDSKGFRKYAFQIGAKPEVDTSIPLTITSGSVGVNQPASDTSKDITIFGLSGYTYSIEQVLWAYGSGDRSEGDFLTQFRTIASGATTAIGFLCVKDFNGQTIIIYEPSAGGTPVIQATRISTTMSANGVYESNAFPLNDGLVGKINKIYVNHKPIPTSCGFTVAIKHFGNYPWSGSVPSAESYQNLLGPQGNAATSGLTQSTNNASYTEIQSDKFVQARYAQIKISFDEINSADAASVVFPIIIELVD